MMHWLATCFLCITVLSTARKEVTIVPFGITGVGKSETSNTILDRPAFKVSRGIKSETRGIQCENGVHKGERLTLCDIPGVHDTSLSPGEVAALIEPIASSSENGVDAFLFVVPYGRFNSEHVQSWQMMNNMFGTHVSQHVVLVFTKCGEQKEADIVTEFEETCQQEPQSPMCKVFTEVGHLGINNIVAFGELNSARKRDDRERLLNAVEAVVRKNQGRKYDNVQFSRVRQRRAVLRQRLINLPLKYQGVGERMLQEVSIGRETEANLESHLSDMEKKYEEQREENERRQRERRESEERHDQLMHELALKQELLELQREQLKEQQDQANGFATAGTGAVIGGSVGGPAGAAIGAAVGGLLGAIARG